MIEMAEQTYFIEMEPLVCGEVPAGTNLLDAAYSLGWGWYPFALVKVGAKVV